MKTMENMLKRQLNKDQGLTYPDFEKMWNRMEQDGNTSPPVFSSIESVAPVRLRRWRKITIAASLSALLAGVPVYAAVQYDWSSLLRDKGGVQAALAQNLGQQLNQSLTMDGVTLTLHTAIVDENRTVILYSLDVGERAESENWNIKGMSIKDANGNTSNFEYNNQQWDEKNQRYNGYFESDWTPDQEAANVQLVAEHIQAFSDQSMDVKLDSSTNKMQSFPIERDGIKNIKIQAFNQAKDKLLLSTATTFDQLEAKDWSFPHIVAYKDGTMVKELAGNTFGRPGENGEYTSQQYFKTSEVADKSTAYKLQYTKLEKKIDGPWSFDLQLSRKQMESGTIKTALNIPFEAGDSGHTIEQMVVTPTQIRITLRSNGKDLMGGLAYNNFALEVEGRTVKGGIWSSPKDDRNLTTLRFERPADLEITGKTPITLIGRYKVTIHRDDKTPLLLTDISEKHQTKTRQTGGYPVIWTYYMEGSDLFVETESDDAHFGGVNQTYIGTGSSRIIGKPVTTNFFGDGNNKAIDVYKDFIGKNASIYMFYYTTDEPEKEIRVQLEPEQTKE